MVRSDLSNATSQLVDICQQKDPANWYKSADDLMVALDHALRVERGERPFSQDEPFVQPVETQLVVTEEGGKRPLWLIGVVVVALVLVCCGGFFLLRGLWAGLDTNVVAPPPTLIGAATAVATNTIMPSETAVPLISADVVAVRLSVLPVIDGNLAEWAGITPYLSTHPVYTAPGWDGTADVAAAWHIGWDENALYLGVVVVDDVHVQSQSGNQIFKGDNVDLQLDVDRTGDWGSGLNVDDYQINLSPGNFANLPPSAFRFNATSDGGSVDAPGHGIQIAAQPQPDGYTIEAAIPWRDVNVTPSVGLILGAALNVSDNDTPGTAVQEYFLSTAATRKWSDPTTWGTLTLSE